MHIKEKLKNNTPKSIWEFARNMWLSSKEFLELFEDKEKTILYAGIHLHYNRGNSVVARLKNEKVYEEEMCVHLTNTLLKREKPILIDVGANIGLVTSYVLEKVPNIFIYAFEPGPRQAELLRKTISTNALQEKISLAQVALSDTAGTQTFYSHPLRDQAKDGLADTGRGEKTIEIQVETTTLDEWWKKVGKPHIDVVKIDTEGAELLVLRGASKFLKEVKPTIYLEIEESNLKAYPYGKEDLVQFMHSNGYVLETLKGQAVDGQNIFKEYSNQDTFCAKYTVF